VGLHRSSQILPQAGCQPWSGGGGPIAPFSSVLLRTESAASSNIENLMASARAIAEAELPGAKTTANAKVIIANTAAMVAAINLADNIDADAILAMHKALMRDVGPKSAGRWREEQVLVSLTLPTRTEERHRELRASVDTRPSTPSEAFHCGVSRSHAARTSLLVTARIVASTSVPRFASSAT
jgi:hypothetical protein